MSQITLGARVEVTGITEESAENKFIFIGQKAVVRYIHPTNPIFPFELEFQHEAFEMLNTERELLFSSFELTVIEIDRETKERDGTSIISLDEISIDDEEDMVEGEDIVDDEEDKTNSIATLTEDDVEGVEYAVGVKKEPKLKVGDIVEINNTLSSAYVGRQSRIINIIYDEELEEFSYELAITGKKKCNDDYEDFYEEELTFIREKMYEVEVGTVKFEEKLIDYRLIVSEPAVILILEDGNMKAKGISRCDETCNLFDVQHGYKIASRRAYMSFLKQSLDKLIEESPTYPVGENPKNKCKI